MSKPASTVARNRRVARTVAVLGAVVGVAALRWCKAADPAAPAAHSPSNAHANSSIRQPNGAETVGPGSEELRGRIVDVAGGALPDIAVTASLELGPGIDVRADDPAYRGFPEVRTISDAGGAFRLRGLVAARFRLLAQGDAVLPAEVRFVEVPAAGDVVIVVARKTEIRGRVEHEGRGVANAEVIVLSESLLPVQTVHTKQDGAFVVEDIAEGVYGVRATTDGLASATQSVLRLGAGPFADVVLTMAPAMPVAGRIVDAQTGRGVAAELVLVAEDENELPHASASDDDGRFVIPAVRPGRWTLRAQSPGYLPSEGLAFNVGTGYSPELRLQRGIALACVVRNDDGKPIAEAVATLLAQPRDAGPSYSAMGASDSAFASLAQAPVTAGQTFVPSGELGILLGPLPFPPPPGAHSVAVAQPLASAPAPAVPFADDTLLSSLISDEEGELRITGIRAGRYILRLQHAEYADAWLELSLNGDREIELRMPLGRMLAGEVVDEHGAPVIGARVTADVQGLEEARVEGVTGSDGRYALGPIAGNRDVVVGAYGFGHAQRSIVVARRADLVDGAHREDFRLAHADRQIRGRVVDGQGAVIKDAIVSVAMNAADAAASAQGATSAADGSFVIEGLVAGEHSLWVEHPDYPALRVRAQTGELLTATLPLGGGISGIVRSEGALGAVSGASINARGPSGEMLQVVSDEQGQFELLALATGEWQVEVAAAGYSEWRESVRVPASTTPRTASIHNFRVDLRRGAVVAGVVRDARGDRVAGARVRCGTVEVVADEHGQFRMEGTPVGAVELVAESSGRRGTLQLDLAPGAEWVTLEIVLPE